MSNPEDEAGVEAGSYGDIKARSDGAWEPGVRAPSGTKCVARFTAGSSSVARFALRGHRGVTTALLFFLRAPLFYECLLSLQRSSCQALICGSALSTVAYDQAYLELSSENRDRRECYARIADIPPDSGLIPLLVAHDPRVFPPPPRC